MKIKYQNTTSPPTMAVKYILEIRLFAENDVTDKRCDTRPSFPKNICAMGNPNNLVQNLNSVRRVHSLRR